jgi:hypothetical protein
MKTYVVKLPEQSTPEPAVASHPVKNLILKPLFVFINLVLLYYANKSYSDF